MFFSLSILINIVLINFQGVQQIREESDPLGRYSRALRFLGDYPTGPQDELKKLDVFVDGLANDQRMGRIRLGMEIEPALHDPRWIVSL